MNCFKEARIKSGLTQKELSMVTDIDQAEISKIESGNANPSIKTLERLAQGMGMELRVSFEFPKQGHRLRLEYYNGEILCSTIRVDETNHTVSVINHTDDVVHTAFGKNIDPSWEDYQDFLEERCIPRTREGLRDYLDAIGVAEYDPLSIIRKTDGRMAEDHQWIRVIDDEY